MTQAKAMTIPELNAEVARLEAEQAEEARQAMLALNTERADYYRAIVARGKELDETLEAEGRAAEEVARAAVTAGDLNGAFAGWCGYNRSRRIRYQVRSLVQSGANYLGVSAYTQADLNQYTGTFTDWLSGVENLAVEAGVAERVDEILGTIPGTD